MSIVKVKNRKRTSNNKLPEGFSSWKEYWKDNKEYWPSKCCVEKCKEKAYDGAHVYKKEKSKITYIVPMCREHNNPNNEDVMLIDEKYLVEIED